MKKLIFFVFLVVTVFNSPMVWADEIADLRAEMAQLRADYEAKISQLQIQVDELAEVKETVVELEEKVDKGLIEMDYVSAEESVFGKGGIVFGDGSGAAQVTLGGYMDHEFENFENTDSTFDQHRWVINIGAEIGDRLRFYSEYEIEHGGPDAAGGGEAKVEQAWVDYLIHETFNVRGGALLVPFGRLNLYHDSNERDLTSRALVNRDIIPTTWTESGAGFHGVFDSAFNNEDLRIEYETYVVNGLDDGFTSTSLRGARGSLGSDNNNSKSWVGRVVVSPAIGHEVGFSGYWGNYNDDGDAITGGAVDFLSTWGPVELVGEYAYFDVDEPALTDVANVFEGYHLQVNYHFWPAFLNETFLKRDFDNPTFTLVGRYGWARIEDDSDIDFGENEEDRWTLGINYRPVENWVLKFEYQWNHTDNEKLERGDNNGFLTSVAMGF